MYTFIRQLLFWFPPESVHYFSMNMLKLGCRIPFIRRRLTKQFQPPEGLNKELFGIHFKNPVGLAAGFDKNALYLTELEALGFGFVEIGTVTPKPQAGNDKPRLFRLPKDKALINRMGFNNDGVKVVAARLKEWRESVAKSRESKAGSQESGAVKDDLYPGIRTHDLRLVIGGNIGKNKITPNEDAWKDYELCFRELFDCVDFFVVNVSSPNTPGLRELQEKDSLRKILSHLQTVNRQLVLNESDQKPKPLLLKIAPDLTWQQVDDVIDLALEINLDGLVASNTTISRENLITPSSQLATIGNGGLSGAPLRERSTEIVRYICQKTNGRIPVIASGGIFTGEDALEKLEAGASLVQVWTGFIYKGPAIVKKICAGLKGNGQ